MIASQLNVSDKAEAERLGALRSYQAERLAGDVYSRLLANPALLNLFGDQSAIDAFWRLTSDERRNAWSTPLNLDHAGPENIPGSLTCCAKREIALVVVPLPTP